MINAIRAFSYRRVPEVALLSAAVVIIVTCCVVPFALPTEPATNVLLAGLSGAQLAAYTVYFRLHWHDRQRAGEARWREPRPIYALPVVGAVSSLPAIASQTVDIARVDAGRLVLAMLILGAATIVLSYLALVFVWAPLEMVARGLIRLLTGNRDGLSYVAVGGVISVVTAFAVTGSLAVDTSAHVAQPGTQGDMVAALLGVPGDYTVAEPELLIVTRVLGAVLLLIPLALIIAAVGELLRRIGKRGGGAVGEESQNSVPAGGRG